MLRRNLSGLYLPTALAALAFLLIGMAADLDARTIKRAETRGQEVENPCRFFRECERSLDFGDVNAFTGVCPGTGDVGHFTLRFTGVDNDYSDSTSMWFYVLEWDEQDPPLEEFILGTGSCIVRATFISACPSGYVVGIDAGTSVYGVKWSSVPHIPELHISFLLDGIFPVAAMPFAVKAGGAFGIGSICAPACDTQCSLEIECPPDVTVDCQEPTDPSFTGYPEIEGSCPPFDTTFADRVLQEECPYIIERTWTVTDASGLIAECVQMIVADDDTPPEITCPPDVDYECDDIGPFGEATAQDNCDPDPGLSYEDSVTYYRCPWEYTKKRIWTAVDACGNSSSCIQMIRIHDSNPPVITYCPADDTVACYDEIDWSDMATAEDACSPVCTMKYLIAREEPQPLCDYLVRREWRFKDGCGDSVSCFQLIQVRDTIPPVLLCAEDYVIPCEGEVIFTDPQVTDNCDPDPTFAEILTATEEGPEPWAYTHKKCWEAVDQCANADTCCQHIYEEPCGDGTCTYTQGGWGSGCPETQQGDSTSTQPGCIRDHYFDMVFPDGVMIGDTTGTGSYGSVWTTAAAIEAFLPAGGTPAALAGDLVDPTITPAGILAGQVLALRMNREYSCAGVLEILDLVLETICLGDMEIPASCGVFAGLTVDEFLTLADQATAGDGSVLEPYGATYSDVNETATCLNELYDDCGEPDDPEIDTSPIEIIIDPGPGSDSASDDKQFDVTLPEEITISGHPNPLTGNTTISYSVPADGRVTVGIYDIHGRKVASLVDASKSAGFHGVLWNGKDNTGSPAASGVYFCRVRLEGRPAVMEKLIRL